MIRKNVVMAFLVVLCLSFTFTVLPIRSSSTKNAAATSTPNYDPWADTNDDGLIDMSDIGYLASLFLASGTPINKTALLLQLQSDVASLNSSLLALENTVATQQSTITNQQSEINNLGAELATKLGTPDYDSGWTAINPSQSITLTHNLGTTNVLVYMLGQYFSLGNTWEIHQVEYGGDANGNSAYGANWNQLTPTTITIQRMNADVWWQYFRVYIWKLP